MADVKVAECDGIVMGYAVFGEGDKDFVIIPGLSIKGVTGSVRFMAGVEKAYNAFRRSYRIWVFDRRSNCTEGYSIQDMAEDTYRIMKHLSLKRIDLFGASQGGMVSLALAIAHPKFINHLVIGSSASRIPSMTRSLLVDWIAKAKADDRLGLLQSFIDHLYSQEFLKLHREAILAHDPGYTREELDHFIILASSILHFDVYGQLSSIKAKTLIMGAVDDHILGMDPSVDMEKVLGCALYVFQTGYGHAAFDEAPDYTERILSFLQE